MSNHTALRLLGGVLCIALVTVAGCDSNGKSKASASPTPPSGPSQPDASPAPKPPETIPESYQRDPQKLNVDSSYPAPGGERIALVAQIEVGFDEDLIAGLETDNLIRLYQGNTLVTGVVSQSAPHTLVFTPEAQLTPLAQYRVELDNSLMSYTGRPLNPLSWTFTTIADVYTTSQDVIDQCMSELDVEMLAAVNGARQQSRQCGEQDSPAVERLQWNCLLQEAAIIHSSDMATHNFFEHEGSDGSRIGDRVTRTGYRWAYAGENLAAGHYSVKEVVRDLLESPGHCLNIMSPHFKEFGFGYVYSDSAEYHRYWTQTFALPR